MYVVCGAPIDMIPVSSWGSVSVIISSRGNGVLVYVCMYLVIARSRIIRAQEDRQGQERKYTGKRPNGPWSDGAQGSLDSRHPGTLGSRLVSSILRVVWAGFESRNFS